MPRKLFSTASLFPFLLEHDPFCHSDNGTFSNGSAGGDADGGNAANSSVSSGTAVHTPPPVVDFSQFTAGIEKLSDTLSTRLDALRGDVNQLPEHLRPPAQEPPPPDLDSMTQAELANHLTTSILGAIEKKLNEALSPLTQQINNVQQAHTTSTVTAEINSLRSEHKDFNDWKDEMVGLARQHPTLGVGQLYKLARSENPTRAAELDNKYNPPKPPPPKWGGLIPTARGNGAPPVLSKADASTEAYREVQARHPGVLAALESL